VKTGVYLQTLRVIKPYFANHLQVTGTGDDFSAGLPTAHYPLNPKISTEKTMEEIKTIEIHDKIFEETYTAHIQRNGTNWLGWIPDVPKVKCEESTEKTLLKTLEKKLHEALVAEEEAWEKQFEEDVKAGKLDHLRKEALEDVRAGRFKYL
jgi:hypothetical protein